MIASMTLAAVGATAWMVACSALRASNWSLDSDWKYGQNTLNLVLAVAYLRKLLENHGVARYLAQHHAGVLSEFQKLTEAPDLKSVN